MLLLHRGIGERIVIGEGPDQVIVTVVAVRGGKVRIGITAPRDMIVHREEIVRRIKEQRAREDGA